jgi:polyhydroxyalkanoate synthesis regulator phasin
MLIHETVKGIYMLLQSAAIKSNPELAEEIKKATSSYRDESEDFRYGNLAYAMFRDFINNFDDANKYSNINIKEKIYAKLSADEKRGGMFSDGEFLEITNSIFSSFDKVEENGKIKFNINADRFNESIAKEKLEDIIKEIVENEDRYQEELRDYEEALRKWELEQQFGASDYDDDKDRDEDEEHPEPGKEEGQSEIDRLTRQTAEREQDLSNLTPREIQELIDDALDRGDYDEVRKLSPFLGESANIYLKEMNRIFELKNYERK